MMITNLLLAATAAISSSPDSGHEAALGVTATVIRPVQVSAPAIDSHGAFVTIRNAAGIVVLTEGATVRQAEPETVTVIGDRSDPIAISIVY